MIYRIRKYLYYELMKIKEKKITNSRYSQDTITRARELYFLDCPVKDILTQLKINNVRVIYGWVEKYGWDKDKPPISAFTATTIRFNAILDIKNKTGMELQEMEILANILDKWRRTEIECSDRIDKKNKTSELQSKGVAKNSKEAKQNDKKRKKNEIGHITQEQFDAFFKDNYYPHQIIPHLASKDPETYRTHFILKPRQVGGTYGISGTSFERACMKGHNQIFISATKAQAEQFKSYIAAIAMKHFDVEISGNPSRLTKDGVPHAELHYLSPNSNAQSRPGDVVFDEVFWTANFKKMEQVAKPMSTQKQYSRTYISTPSTIGHDAYEYWNGEWFNNYHKASERVDIDINDKVALKKGRLDGDGIWRYAYTVHDAVESGFDLVDIEQLRLETPDPAIFACLYECQFIDDRSSVFKLKDILACAVDTKKWVEFDKDADRPYGNLPVSGGYDPAGVGDNASFVLLSKPANVTEKFRQLVSLSWKGVTASQQCAQIKNHAERYQIENFFIDATGAGFYVSDLIADFFPMLTRIQYSPEEKSRMIQKALSVIQDKRFEYDETNKDLALAFMTVYQTVTGTGQITYASTRSKRVGHGDEAWAVMQAMMCEPINLLKNSKTKIRVYN